MALDERARHELFLGLEQVLGPERAETLMELMPPVGWADVATKRDLDALEERMHLRFELVDRRFEGVDRRFDALEQRFGALDERFGASEHKLMAAFRAELLTQTNVLTAQMNGMTAQIRVLILGIIGTMVSVAALVVGALRLS
jgi:hypothetical protein